MPLSSSAITPQTSTLANPNLLTNPLTNAMGGAAMQQMYGLQLQGQAGDYALKQAKMAQQGQLGAAQTAAGASKYNSATQLQGLQAQLAQSQGRYNQIFPMLAGAYGQISGAAGGGMAPAGGGGGSYMSQSTALANQPDPIRPSQAGQVGGGAVGNYGYGTAQAPPAGNTSVVGMGGPMEAWMAANQGLQHPDDAYRARLAAQSGGREGTETYDAKGNVVTSGGGSSGGGGGSSGGGGYQSALPPAISQGQLNANINLNNAQNWAQAGGESRRQTQQVAGSGLGATSPLARALQAQTFGGALAANTAGATTARQGAAELNAKQLLGAYQADQAAQASRYGSQVGAQASMYGSQAAANASQYGSQLNYQAALAQVQAQRQNALLQALSNFAGSV